MLKKLLIIYRKAGSNTSVKIASWRHASIIFDDSAAKSCHLQTRYITSEHEYYRQVQIVTFQQIFDIQDIINAIYTARVAQQSCNHLTNFIQLIDSILLCA